MSDSVRGGSDADAPRRRERAAIAAQACQTCRARKSKCDEQRPRCSLCQRLDVECQYREPLPTKKDKTMVHILESLVRLETKFDNIAVALPTTKSTSRQIVQQDGIPGSPSGDAFDRREQRSFTDAHAVLTWPTIYVRLISTGLPAASDLPDILQQGSAWFRQLQVSDRMRLPDSNATLQSVPKDGEGMLSVTFPWLTIQQTQIYAEAYFHTFNVVSPILDQEAFVDDVASPVLRSGYRYGDIKSVVALLVYALGQLVMEGTLDDPIATSGGRRSGIRGGTAADPPGLASFNEARRRMGLLHGQFSVEDVQMRLLAATYLDASGLHMDFWRMTASASSSCELLLRSADVKWNSARGETIKRLFWICHLNELMCYSYLGLPPTNLVHLKDLVPAPSSLDGYSRMSGKALDEERNHKQLYFPAILSLEQLIQEIHVSILAPTMEQTKTTAGMTGPSLPALREMARQLDAWRSLLPRSLQWLDSEMFDFPSSEIGVRRPTEPIFAMDQGSVPIRHRYNLDITTAHLRSRFYLARHLLYQPFIYKVLHFSELLTTDDIECASLALRSALMWPILMAPPKDKKRLVPYAFSWTTTCTSMLLILKMACTHDQLKNITEANIDPVLLKNTVVLMLDWLHDIQLVNPVAAWAWELIEPLFTDGN